MARFSRTSEGVTGDKSSSRKTRYVLDEAERPSKKASSSKPSKHARYEESDDDNDDDEVVSDAVSSEEDVITEYKDKRGKRRKQPAKRQRRQASYEEDSDDGEGSDYDSAGVDSGSDSNASSGRNADKTLVEDDTPPPPRRRGRAPKAVAKNLKEKQMRPLEEEYNIHEDDEDGEFDQGGAYEDDISLDSADDVEAPTDAYLGGRKGGGPQGKKINSLKRWRHMAEEERHMLVTRGGLIWQAARPLLVAMSEEDRLEAADVLKGLMRGLDAKLAATLIPGTYPMPRHNQDNPNSTAAMANSYAIQSCLMSWSVENQGILKDVDDEEGEIDATLRRLADGDVGNTSQLTDPDRTLTNDQAPPKGFSADILVLESMLVPEASEILALLRSLEEQDINLERAKRRLEAMKRNAERTDSRAVEAHEKILKALSRSITQVHDSGERRPMGRAYEAALSEAARQSLAS